MDGYVDTGIGLIGCNMYAYCNNNPVMFVDPTGQFLLSLFIGRWIVNKINEAITEAENALKDFKNRDGTYSLYDNTRHKKDEVFHEQILSVGISTPSLDLASGDIGIGSIEVDAITGGWETEHFDLSLLDFGHAEAGAEVKNGKATVGAVASAWSPSFAVSFFGIKIEIGAEVGAVGAKATCSTGGISMTGAYIFGLSLAISWD